MGHDDIFNGFKDSFFSTNGGSFRGTDGFSHGFSSFSSLQNPSSSRPSDGYDITSRHSYSNGDGFSRMFQRHAEMMDSHSRMMRETSKMFSVFTGRDLFEEGGFGGRSSGFGFGGSQSRNGERNDRGGGFGFGGIPGVTSQRSERSDGVEGASFGM